MNLIQGAIGHPDLGVIYGLQPKPHTCTAKLSCSQGLRKDTDADLFGSLFDKSAVQSTAKRKHSQ